MNMQLKGWDDIVNRFLPKPVTPGELRRAISQLASSTPASAIAIQSELELPQHSNLALPKLNILLVEDNLVNQHVVQTWLSQAGHTVQVCENGQLALDQLQQYPYDLVLMDVQMPVMDGYEVLAELQKKEHNTVVIVISADIQPKAVERVLALGALRSLQKPLNQQQLHQVLLEVGLL